VVENIFVNMGDKSIIAVIVKEVESVNIKNLETNVEIVTVNHFVNNLNY